MKEVNVNKPGILFKAKKALKKVVSLIFLFFPIIFVNAQHGVRFEDILSWQKLLQKAKAENKYVFVDCYATWCRPCQFMSDSIFSRKETGDFMNGRFLNVKVQMDQTAKDDEIVKRWYNDAKKITDKYNVEAFPTFLFIAPDGEFIYKAVGVFEDPASFIVKASKALDLDEQYFFLLEQYNKGKKDDAFISRLIEAANKAGDEQMIQKLKTKPKKI